MRKIDLQQSPRRKARKSRLFRNLYDAHTIEKRGGCHHNRDVNASKKSLTAGLVVSVCGAIVRPEQSKSVKAGAMKQKLKS
jgi:hypothetical protein